MRKKGGATENEDRYRVITYGLYVVKVMLPAPFAMHLISQANSTAEPHAGWGFCQMCVAWPTNGMPTVAARGTFLALSLISKSA